jgi:hypothetical protein
MSRNYEDDLRIDKNALELEWEKQASIYFYWAQKEAEALEARDRANQRLNVVQAEMDSAIRSDPSKYGLGDKVTETAIKNLVTNSKEYRAAETDVIEKNKTARILGAAVVAFDHKKRGLTKLSDLWLGSYWSNSGGAPKEMRENTAQRKGEEIRQGLNKRIKKSES